MNREARRRRAAWIREAYRPPGLPSLQGQSGGGLFGCRAAWRTTLRQNPPPPLTPAQMCSSFSGMRMKPDPPKKGAGRPRRPVPPAHLDPDAAPSREEEILAFIAGSLRERGYPPTIREIGKAFGIASTNGVR